MSISIPTAVKTAVVVGEGGYLMALIASPWWGSIVDYYLGFVHGVTVTAAMIAAVLTAWVKIRNMMRGKS